MRLYPQANQVDEPAVPTEAVAPPLPQHPAHEHHNCRNLNTFSVPLSGSFNVEMRPEIGFSEHSGMPSGDRPAFGQLFLFGWCARRW